MSTYTLYGGQYPEYTALSYAWGSSEMTASVLLNGVEYGVTPALLEAMQHLRMVDQCQTNFWCIDMLCVNQYDDAERGHQVGIMRHIFQSASRVVAWLGPAASDTSHLMRRLKQWSTSGDCWLNEALELLFRPYWTRLWVVQELCVARNIS